MGLPYMDMRPCTEEEYHQLPHIVLTSDTEWDPTILDHEFSPENDFAADFPQPDTIYDKRINHDGDYLGNMLTKNHNVLPSEQIHVTMAIHRPETLLLMDHELNTSMDEGTLPPIDDISGIFRTHSHDDESMIPIPHGMSLDEDNNTEPTVMITDDTLPDISILEHTDALDIAPTIDFFGHRDQDLNRVANLVDQEMNQLINQGVIQLIDDNPFHLGDANGQRVLNMHINEPTTENEPRVTRVANSNFTPYRGNDTHDPGGTKHIYIHTQHNSPTTTQPSSPDIL
jgi:hypothetical protein